MGRLATEAKNIHEEGPRQTLNLMRTFTEMTGVKLGDGIQEALRRMEADGIEADMADVPEHEDPFAPDNRGAKHRRDETLYEL